MFEYTLSFASLKRLECVRKTWENRTKFAIIRLPSLVPFYFQRKLSNQYKKVQISIEQVLTHKKKSFSKINIDLNKHEKLIEIKQNFVIIRNNPKKKVMLNVTDA